MERKIQTYPYCCTARESAWAARACSPASPRAWYRHRGKPCWAVVNAKISVENAKGGGFFESRSYTERKSGFRKYWDWSGKRPKSGDAEG